MKAIVKTALVLVMGVLFVGLLVAIRPDRTSNEVGQGTMVIDLTRVLELNSARKMNTIINPGGLMVLEYEGGYRLWDFSNYDATAASFESDRWAEARPREVQAAYEEWITPQICGIGLVNGIFPGPEERSRFIAACWSVGVWMTRPQQA